jgi:hypothetical protein
MRELWAAVHHLKVASRVGFVRWSQRHVRLRISGQVTFEPMAMEMHAETNIVKFCGNGRRQK